jgi:ABC-type lipoprotein release transport system permease subunit
VLRTEERFGELFARFEGMTLEVRNYAATNFVRQRRDRRRWWTAAATLALAACVAGIIPSQRAASIDPVRALRVE